jgi:hypothetical protein
MLFVRLFVLAKACYFGFGEGDEFGRHGSGFLKKNCHECEQKVDVSESES